MTELVGREVPSLAPARRPGVPRTSERLLDNGLRVVAVRRPSVPLVHLRLRIPSGVRRAQDLAAVSLLARSMTLGSDRRSEDELADSLQTIGGALNVHSEADGLSLSAESLSAELPALLDLVAELLTGAAYPRAGVEREAVRLADEVGLSASQPGSAAADVWARRRYADHPYGRRFPQVDEVLAVKPGSLRALHRRRVVPDGAVLVLVGDLAPARALEAVEQRLAAWEQRGTTAVVPRVPTVEPGPLLLVHRPGSVQANIRLGTDAPSPGDRRYAATRTADAVFTGLFASRLTANLREDKGYTYGSYSTYRLQRRGAYLATGFDVATEVTAPAIVETIHELGRMVTLPPRQDEVEAASQYLVGTSGMRVATQSGLADALADLGVRGLEVSWMRDHPAELMRVTPDDVHEAARAVFAPTRLVWTILGDADVLHRPLSELTEVTTVDGA